METSCTILSLANSTALRDTGLRTPYRTREKDIVRLLNRGEMSVRKQFQRIRDRLGAKSQADLGRILGVLSCFGEKCMDDSNNR